MTCRPLLPVLAWLLVCPALALGAPPAQITMLNQAGMMGTGQFVNENGFYVSLNPDTDLRSAWGWKVRVNLSDVPAEQRDAKLLAVVNALQAYNAAHMNKGDDVKPKDDLEVVRYKVLLPADHDKTVEKEPEQKGKYVTIYVDEDRDRGRTAEKVIGSLTAALYPVIKDVNAKPDSMVKSDAEVFRGLPLSVTYGGLGATYEETGTGSRRKRVEAEKGDRYPVPAGHEGQIPEEYITRKGGRQFVNDGKYRREGGNACPPWKEASLDAIRRQVRAEVDRLDPDRVVRTEDFPKRLPSDAQTLPDGRVIPGGGSRSSNESSRGTETSTLPDGRRVTRRVDTSTQPGGRAETRLPAIFGLGEKSEASRAAGSLWTRYDHDQATAQPANVYVRDGKGMVPLPAEHTTGAPTNLETILAEGGLNVLKLRALTRRDYLLQTLGLDDPRNRSGDVLKRASAQGVVALPDQQVLADLKVVTESRDQRGRLTGNGQNDQPIAEAAHRVADYLTTNHEMLLIRAQATDPARREALKAWQKSNDNEKSNAVVHKQLEAALLSTWGLKRAPTKDEAHGLHLWDVYFTKREQDGERSVGNLLKSPFLHKGADLMRYGGANEAPADIKDIRPEMLRANEDPNQPTDWKTARQSAGIEREAATDRRSNESPSRSEKGK